MDYALASIKSYFIDDTIIIKNSGYLDNAKQYIVKYRRLIALIFLIILLIIMFYDNNANRCNTKVYSIMHGGAGADANIVPSTDLTTPDASDTAGAKPKKGTTAKIWSATKKKLVL